MATIVDALDDDGFLRMDLQELKALSGLEPSPDDDEMAIALKLVQSLEPAGVGARDLRECLLLQLREDDDPASAAIHELAKRIVNEHLDKLAMRDIPGLARALGVAQHSVSQAGDLTAACNRVRVGSSVQPTRGSLRQTWWCARSVTSGQSR